MNGDIAQLLERSLSMRKVRGSIPGAAEILILQALPKRKELKTLNKSWCMERRSPYDIQFTVLACANVICQLKNTTTQ